MYKPKITDILLQHAFLLSGCNEPHMHHCLLIKLITTLSRCSNIEHDTNIFIKKLYNGKEI